MKVGPGRCREPEALRMCCKGRVLMGPMAAAHHFDRCASSRPELGQQFVQLRRVERVAPGMGNDGNASAACYPARRVAKVCPLMRHVAWLPGAEKTFERAFDVLHHAALDEQTREMRAPYQSRVVGQLARTLKAAPDAKRIQRGGHFLGARGAPASRRSETRLQRRIVRIDAETDDMDGLPAPRHRYFDTVDELEPMTVSGNVRWRKSASIIVVGQRQNPDAALRGARDQFVRAQGAVGVRRMAVQVEINQLGRPDRTAPVKQGSVIKSESYQITQSAGNRPKPHVMACAAPRPNQI